MTSRQKHRYIPWIRYFAVLAVDMAFFGLWLAVFVSRPGTAASLGMGAACAAYSAFKTRVAYVRWMWGPDARVLRRRG
jgi:hypothetical protein